MKQNLHHFSPSPSVGTFCLRCLKLSMRILKIPKRKLCFPADIPIVVPFYMSLLITPGVDPGCCKFIDKFLINKSILIFPLHLLAVFFFR